MSTAEAIKHLFIGYGAGWVLWLLAGLSFVGVAVAFERWLYYRTRGGNLHALAEALDRRLEAEEFDLAIEDLRASPSVAASVARAGLRLAQRGPGAVDKAMESAAALERAELEKRLAYLGTVGNNAPFVGLFGTVIGVIRAFEELGHEVPGHATGASAASQVASQAVMSGIAEALVATAVGIAVALPAVAVYNYFQRRVATLLSGTEVLSNLVLAYLSSSPKNRAPTGSASSPTDTPRRPRPVASDAPPSAGAN